MKKLTSLLLVGLLILCGAPGIAQTKKKQSKSRAGSPVPGTELIAVIDEHMPEVWKSFRSAEGHFSVLFPGEPKELSREQNMQGGKITAHSFKVISTMALYQASFVEFPVKVDAPEKITAVLNGARMDALEQLKGQLLSESDMTFEGHPSRYITWRTDTGMLIKAKYILSDNRIYSLMFGIPEANNLPDVIQKFRKSIATKFFNSFKMSSGSQK